MNVHIVCISGNSFTQMFTHIVSNMIKIITFWKDYILKDNTHIAQQYLIKY